MRMRPMEERKPLNAVVCKRSTRPDSVFYRPYGAQIRHNCKRAVVMYSQYTAWLLGCLLAVSLLRDADGGTAHFPL